MNRRPVAVLLFADLDRARDISERLDAEGIAPRVVSSTDDLHRALNAECIDLVVIENELKGFLSGLEIIERMHNDLLRPAIILLAKPSAETERRCRRLGITRLLRNDIRSDDLVPIAKDALEGSSQQRVVIPAAARQFLREASFLQPLPQLLIQLAGYLERKDQDLKQLAQDISVDAKVTSDLLRVTNSSAMGRPFKTTSIFDAVEFLGVRRAVSIALATGIRAAKTPMLKIVSPKLRNWYNYRSVLIGSTAAAFASLENISAPTAYLLGLLQDIGCLILGSSLGERYDVLLERTQSIQHLCLDQVELAEFHTNHAEISAALLQKWELPPSLIAMVFRHHTTAWQHCSSVEQAFIRVMQIGEHVANLSECRLPKRYMQLNQALAFYGKERANECKQALATAIAQTVESSKLFRIAVPADTELREFLTDMSTEFHRFEPRVSNPEKVQSASEPVSETAASCEEGIVDLVTEAVDTKTRRPRVVVIDDEPSILRLISRFAAELPLDLVECTSFEEAWEAMQTAEIVVCDVHLEGMTGQEIVQTIRAQGLKAKILMISGDTRRDNVEDCITLGIDDFLAKPFSRELLVTKICRLLAEASPSEVGIED